MGTSPANRIKILYFYPQNTDFTPYKGEKLYEPIFIGWPLVAKTPLKA
jgi:hypothetical protein